MFASMMLCHLVKRFGTKRIILTEKWTESKKKIVKKVNDIFSIGKLQMEFPFEENQLNTHCTYLFSMRAVMGAM